jgi:hypothetical protein
MKRAASGAFDPRGRRPAAVYFRKGEQPIFEPAWAEERVCDTRGRQMTNQLSETLETQLHGSSP